ncbi:TPA: fimbrial protein [Klebsiella aerogenes]|nr:fimbrial protein [Klebsiella aerogenes]
MKETKSKAIRKGPQCATRRTRRSRAAGRGLALAMAGTLLISVPLAQAATRDTSNVNINISGTIVANASCNILASRPISVEFGDVYINDIDAGGYRKSIDYDVVCSGDAQGKTIQLRFVGGGASFDGSLLKTDAPGLGIKILRNGAQMTLNQWYDLDWTSPPTLEGVVVKQSGASLNNGQEFSASGSLVVGYN